MINTFFAGWIFIDMVGAMEDFFTKIAAFLFFGFVETVVVLLSWGAVKLMRGDR